MREKQTKITHYINKDSVVVGKVPLKPSSQEELKVLPVLKVVDLIKYVSSDSYDNMAKILLPYRPALIEM